MRKSALLVLSQHKIRSLLLTLSVCFDQRSRSAAAAAANEINTYAVRTRQDQPDNLVDPLPLALKWVETK